MNHPDRKARIEKALLQIWYGGTKPGWLAHAALSVLEQVYKNLRLLTRQNSKVLSSKKNTNPPVLVVGNLIAGGAGKTPIVMAFCQHLRAVGKKVGIVSRGYGRQGNRAALIDPSKPLPPASAVGDEPLLLCAQTHCPVAVCADRAEALDMLLTAFPNLDLVVSDDGLQHHRLARQLEWIVFDERAAGNGRLLPAGPLREPLSRLNTVDAVLASNIGIDQLSTALNTAAKHNWYAVQVSLHGFSHLQTGQFMSADQANIAWKDTALLAFTGMANPDKLFNSIKATGLELQQTCGLPDHYSYPIDFCAQFDQPILITSGKDAVKLNASNPRVWVAEIHIELPTALTQALEDCIGSTID